MTSKSSLILSIGPSPSGDVSITVESPGVSSRTRLTSDSVSLCTTGAKGIGREGELRVLNTLVRKLALQGLPAKKSSGQDNRGEDAILIIAGRRIVVQIVTAPLESEFWRKASGGTASREVDLLCALEGLRAAIDKKVLRIAPRDRAKILLAIDANHAGIFGTKRIVDEYTGRFGSPDTEYGLDSVWIVGPTIEYCARLKRDALTVDVKSES
jgi:hypothetical protein